jgi:hypothetical protein
MRKQFIVAEVAQRNFLDAHNGSESEVHALELWNDDRFDTEEQAVQFVENLIQDTKWTHHEFTIIPVFTRKN